MWDFLENKNAGISLMVMSVWVIVINHHDQSLEILLGWFASRRKTQKTATSLIASNGNNKQRNPPSCHHWCIWSVIGFGYSASKVLSIVLLYIIHFSSCWHAQSLLYFEDATHCMAQRSCCSIQHDHHAKNKTKESEAIKTSQGLQIDNNQPFGDQW